MAFAIVKRANVKLAATRRYCIDIAMFMEYRTEIFGFLEQRYISGRGSVTEEELRKKEQSRIVPVYTLLVQVEAIF